MGILEELQADLEQQQAEKESRLVYETIPELHKLVQTGPEQEYATQEALFKADPIAVHLCVVSYTPFSKGWHYELTNKAIGDNFDAAAKMLMEIKPPRRAKHIFRLTVWDSKKRERKEKLPQPGQLLFTDSVYHLVLYAATGMAQGETQLASIMKVEEERPHKKSTAAMATPVP